MNRIVIGWAFLAGLLLAFGVDVRALICLPLVLLIVAGGFSLIIAQKFPRRFLLMVGALALGPYLFAAVVKGWAQTLLEHSDGLSSASENNSGWLSLALLCLVLGVSFIAYCIREARRRHGNALAEVRGAERTPFVPQHVDGEEQ